MNFIPPDALQSIMFAKGLAITFVQLTKATGPDKLRSAQLFVSFLVPTGLCLWGHVGEGGRV